MVFDQSMNSAYKPARRMHNRSVDTNASKFDLKHSYALPPQVETKATKRPRSPWIRDPFQSQIRIFE